MHSEIQSYRPQLAVTQWYRGIPADLQDYLLAHSSLVRVGKGQRLYKRGDSFSGLYAILDGALAMGTVVADGREALHAVLGPTAWIGEISMFDGLPRPHDALAMTNVLVLHVHGSALKKLLADKPAYWAYFGMLMAQKIRVSFENNESMQLLSAAQRLASRLLLIAGGYSGISQTQSTLKIAQDTLGSMISLTRQTTNLLLKNLEGQGIISLKVGEITIRDFERLRAASLGNAIH
ncbi:Crp/Fnr family transcriptional regulator [Pseudomonas sp. Pseu.R1]|uniref:Crp/Fnr family transcriptional regulator n=1 Tax=Pseudomonas sp. Pseu.R1 TaxID=3379818 RepID=UPI003B952302